jgi:curved DNA-binding protein CbpA
LKFYVLYAQTIITKGHAMRTSGPQEGVDYLVDYYAILGVARDAPAEQIEDAFRDKIKQWHPDRMHGLAPTLVAQAERQSGLLNNAHAILGNAEARRVFDAKLAGWTKPVSKDGNAIIDLGSGSFSFSALLEATSEDPAERERYATQMARQFSNFDETTYELVKEQMASSSEPSPALKKAYTAQLQARDLYLTLLEDFLREDLGIQGHVGRESTVHYLEQVESELGKIKDETTAALNEQVLLLEGGGQALLPPPQGSTGVLVPAEVRKHWEAKLGAHFEEKAVKLRELAQEREALIAERFKAAGIEYHPANKGFYPRLIVRFRKQDGSCVRALSFIIEGTSLNTGDAEDLERLDEPGVAEDFAARGYSIVSYTPVADIEWKSQLTRVVELHVEKMQAQ